MTTDELIEKAAKAIWGASGPWTERSQAIWNQMSDDAQEYTRMQARAAFTVFEQAQAGPEYRIDDGAVIARTFTRSRVDRALQAGSLVWRRVPGRAPGPWVPMEATDE